jgi:surface carbohydrate biosynthesis protein
MPTYQLPRKRWLHLPIEVKSRELNSKLLLAYVAISRGFGVFIGPNGFNSDNTIPRGIFFDKCISRRRTQYLEYQVNTLQNLLVSLDEEGLLFRSDRDYLNGRTSEKAVALSSRIFTWGKKQSDLLYSRYETESKIAQVGSPRVDIWKPELSLIYDKTAKAITEQYGNYILIPSNFAVAPSFEGQKKLIQKLIEYGLIDATTDMELTERRFDYINRVRGDILSLVPIIAEEFPADNIIIRPHPSDDMSFWHEFDKSCPSNTRVIYRGDINPWCQSADLIIHNNCTTAVEAFFSGKPVLAYTKTTSDESDFILPHALSMCFASKDDLVGAIKRVRIDSRHFKADNASLVDNYIANASGPPASGALNIVEELLKLDCPEKRYRVKPYGLSAQLRTTKTIVTRRLKDVFGLNEFSHAERKQKNPGISLSEVNEALTAFHLSLNLAGDIECHQVGENSFCLFSHD